MKSDLDQHMEEAGIDAILITGSADHNPALAYFTGPAHLSIAELIKKRGEPPVLIHTDMERDEAARTGLRTKDRSAYDIPALDRQGGGGHPPLPGGLYPRKPEEI